jgi:GNAT superfamily N-acetyltransferase
MIIDATAPELCSDEALAKFLKGFEDCTIPDKEWTHAAHVAMAAAYLLKYEWNEALDKARSGIQKFNAHHGGAPQLYHESLTRFWIHVCHAFLNEVGLPGAEATRALIATYGRRSDLYKEYYLYDALQSEEARREWRTPDAKPLPAAWRRGELLISTNPRLLHLDTIHQFLKESYWAPEIPKHVVQRCIRDSISFGVYLAGRQVGFARVITDLATFGYLADVFILEPHRGQGLSKRLMECVMQHPNLQGFRRWLLATRDAHGLYENYGFKKLAHPERMMEIARPDIYRKEEAEAAG